jgi:hypothetical protein
MNAAIVNITPFPAVLLTGSNGQDASTFLAKATFELSAAATGGVAHGPCAYAQGYADVRVAKQQVPLVGGDLHPDDSESSAVHYESDFAPFKPRADVLCVGKAYAPRGVTTTESFVAFSVGRVNKTIRVVGHRRWIPILGPLLAVRSKPEPFASIPISFDHAFGGKNAGKPKGFRFYPLNVVGRGYSRWGWGLKNLALPNLEDPRHPIRFWWQRPKPMSFGPVGRTWRPRVGLAGTYDKKWLKERAPALPEDFNEAYYNCAPDDQQIEGYLRGDEEVRVQNMHPEHRDLRFRLPGIRVRALLDRVVGGICRFEEIPMNLDTLWVDMDALQFVLVWRGRVAPTSADSTATVLLVDEPLSAAPRPPETYRAKLREIQAEAASADAESDAAERELEARGADETEIPPTPPATPAPPRPRAAGNLPRATSAA